MSKHVLTCLGVVFILSSCISTFHNNVPIDFGNSNSLLNTQPVTSSFNDVDTALIIPHELPVDKSPVSLMELPRTEEGAFVLSSGFYEADFKTYCLEPGTPAPSANDAYFQAPLKGARKEIIETILINSQKEKHLDQKNIQLLLWSVVSRSDFDKLSPAVRSTAMQLLSPKQVFELRGGVLGMAKTVVKVLPVSSGQDKLQQLFNLGTSSYEAYERLAVVNGPSEIRRPDFKHNQWYKHEDGYYVRYFPNSYKKTKIQVYVPESAVDTVAQNRGEYIVFDPVSMVILSANSNSQDLGVGGPVLDIVGTVIRVIGSNKGGQRTKTPNSTSSPGPNQSY